MPQQEETLEIKDMARRSPLGQTTGKKSKQSRSMRGLISILFCGGEGGACGWYIGGGLNVEGELIWAPVGAGFLDYLDGGKSH